MKSYLIDRFQLITYNNDYSSPISILSGVPQGSILGPLLYIIYTADILHSVTSCSIQAYADDTQLYTTFSNSDYLSAMCLINRELEHIKEVAEQHNMMLNPAKSAAMLFASRNSFNFLKENMHISLDGTLLVFEQCSKILGITLDSDLRFREYVKRLMQKSYSSLRLLYSERHAMSINIKITLCNALVLSHFNYCDFVYGSCLDLRDKHRIQSVQNACCRFVFSLRKYDHISAEFKSLNWLNMETRRVHHLGVYVHRILNTDNVPKSIKGKFISRSSMHSVNIRYPNVYVTPRHRTAKFERAFIYKAIKLYNTLPTEFKIYNINKFKYKFKNMLLER